jgi:hypothetical protein
LSPSGSYAFFTWRSRASLGIDPGPAGGGHFPDPSLRWIDLPYVHKALTNPLDEIGPFPCRRIVLKPLLLFLGSQLWKVLRDKRVHFTRPTFAPKLDQRCQKGHFDFGLSRKWQGILLESQYRLTASQRAFWRRYGGAI